MEGSQRDRSGAVPGRVFTKRNKINIRSAAVACLECGRRARARGLGSNRFVASGLSMRGVPRVLQPNLNAMSMGNRL